MGSEDYTFVPGIRTLYDVVEGMADILYVYGPERSGWPSFYYERIFSAMKEDLKGKGEKELSIEDLRWTSVVVDTILSEEDELIVKGRIKRAAFHEWILQHALRAYRIRHREDFRKALINNECEYERYEW